MLAFSSRVPSTLRPNRLTRTLDRLQAEGVHYADLTESNPTRVGFAYPSGLLEPLASRRGMTYEPAALGLSGAREAVAAALRRRDLPADARRVVVTASTSDAYSMLFKLLCDAGHEVAVPRPSYPLFEYLTRLDAIRQVPYPLEFHGRWSINQTELRQSVTSRSRAIILVNPNNPTGSFVSDDDLETVIELCHERGLALIADEVFGWYPVTDGERKRGPSVLDRPAKVLTFVLGGLSKGVGMPQLKFGWIVVTGPETAVEAALARLELIGDTYLGVSSPVQLAAPALFERGAVVTTQIADRIRTNTRCLSVVAADYPAATVLPVEGGWSAVVQVPRLRSEERLVVELLERERVLVHPGYFFDFPREAFLVLSLLVDPASFEPAVRRVLSTAVSTPA